VLWKWVLREISQPNGQEIIWERENYIMSSFNNLWVIRVTKVRRVKRMGHVACMGDQKGMQKFTLQSSMKAQWGSRGIDLHFL
jgi:hypothetical protein